MGRDLMEAFQLGQSVLRSLTFCILSGCGSQYLLIADAGGSFFDGE